MKDRVPLLLVLIAIACNSGTPPPDKPTPPVDKPTPPVEKRQPPADNVTSGSAADEALITRVCSGTCSGRMARVEIWRDASGAIGRLVYDGDIQRCSHPPRYYFDRDGKQTLAIPFEPIEPGSPKALEYQRTQAEQIAGLTKDRVVSCAARASP
jgi:hypothetical protein